ncbi:hypothetical protein ACHHYP_11657 [Achlya hypogyna]|uniref:Fibronectin type-III domain-containing protein n=1 Tax=Achlya hypogyna TaxID=1202772 RepID=A0A1V9YIN3_ACHHY|nr:hypothetical protein ACHHYP_11657 [Achlya hypogyna]
MQATDTAAVIQSLADEVAADEERKRVLKEVLEMRKAYRDTAARQVQREEAARLKKAKEADAAKDLALRTVAGSQGPKTSPKKTKAKKATSQDLSAAVSAPLKQPRDFEDPLFTASVPVASPGDMSLSALIVVVTQFKNGFPPLPASARAAAESLHELLTDPILGGLKQAQCKLLVNPSVIEFKVELASFQDTPPTGSFFLLIISHGARVVSGPHLGSYVLFPEARLSSVDELVLTSLHERTLAAALRQIPAAAKLIALDVCQDQDVAPNAPDTAIKGRVHAEMAARLLALIHEGEPKDAALPVVLLEACKPRTQTALFSPEDPRVQSLFPRRLVDAFRGGGTSQGTRDYFGNWADDPKWPPFLYLRGIVNYVVSHVQFDAYCHAERTKPADRQAALAHALGPPVEQTPQVTARTGAVDFPIARRPQPPKISPLAPTLVPTGTQTSLTVTWTAPLPWPPAKAPKPLSPVVGYHVEYKGAGPACEEWRLVGTYLVRSYDEVVHDGIEPATTATAVGLAPGAGYCFRVRARNVGGWGPFSPPSPPFWTRPISSSTAYDTDAVSLAATGPAAVVAWMQRYASVGGVQRAGCDAMLSTALAAVGVMRSGVLEAVLAALKNFTDDAALQLAATRLLGHLARHSDVRRAMTPTQLHSAKFLLEAQRAKFTAALYPEAYATASWALRLLQEPVRRRAPGMQEAAMKIQGLYRQRMARRRLRALVAATYQYTLDPTTGLGYYVNVHTGAAVWRPPFV